MADDQYEKYSRMLELLENGARTAEELLVKTGEHPIGAEDWADQIRMINAAIEYGNSELTTRAETLLVQLQRLKP